MPDRDFNGSIEQRLRRIELWRVHVDNELTDARDVRLKYLPLIDDLVSRDKIAIEVGAAMRRVEARGWTRMERLMYVGLFIFSALGACGTIVSIYIAVHAGA